MGVKLEGKRVRIVLYEGDGTTPLDDNARFESILALLEDGHPVTRPAVGKGGAVAPSDSSDHLVLGRFDPLPEGVDGAEFVDIAGMAPADVRDKVRERVTVLKSEVRSFSDTHRALKPSSRSCADAFSTR